MLFKTKSEYVDHLKDIAWHRFRERKYDAVSSKLTARIAERKDYVRTPADLEEFINENIQLAFEAVTWQTYNSVRQYLFEFKSCKVRYSRTACIYSGPVMVLNVDLDYTCTNNPYFLSKHKRLTSLGLHTDYYDISAGEWYRLNAIAVEHYESEITKWRLNEEHNKVVAKLKNVLYVNSDFKYKGINYAESNGLSVPSHENVISTRSKISI